MRLPDFGLRAFAGNFSWAELAQALSLLHGAGKKFYLTLNILPYDDEMDALTAAARRNQGMTSLREAALDLVRQGETTPEELLKITFYEE